MSAAKSPQPRPISSTALHRIALSNLSLPPQSPPTQPVSAPPASIPHSKLIPKTRFIVDGFKHSDSNFSVSYFLSHFHSDHYTGLTPQWSQGIIYCSPTTACLLRSILNIPEPFIFPLSLSQSVLIDGAEVFLVDANHCPGAVQFLFKVPVSNRKVVGFEKYVHTGDFRYCDEMKSEDVLREFIGADGVFLDTTYCNPKFVFPGQEESIDYIVGVIKNIGVENEGGLNAKNVLFVVATYVIGKERILLEISRKCKRKIHVSSRKMAVLCALGLEEGGVFTENESESDVHVVGWNVLGETWPYFRPNFVKMKEIMSEKGYSKVVGFVPTGWTYEIKRNKFAVRSKDSFEIHLVPYSEHSNYNELREYVKFLKPKHIIPTVGADIEKIDSKHANAMRKHFAGLVDEMAIKQNFLLGFIRGGKGVEQEDDDKDCSFASENFQKEEDKVTLSAPYFQNDVELEGDTKCSFPHQDDVTCGSEDMKEDDVDKSVQELRECLPSWVTQCQILDLLSGARGNVVEAVSNFYEHETEFYEQALPSTSVSCTFQESSESQPALSFKPQPVNSTNLADGVLFSQSFKLSGAGDLKKSGFSPGKRKKNLDSKAIKRARADVGRVSSDKKQHSITKFFSKKTSDISKDCKVESSYCGNDQRRFPIDAADPYKEEEDQFIQIVNGDESLRNYAATVLWKAEGDINTALDVYYSDNTGISNETKHKLLNSHKKMEAESSSSICSVDRNYELSESNRYDIKLNIGCTALNKDDVSINYVSLPPEIYSPIDYACWRKGQPAPYIHIARTFDLVEEEKGKLKATSMLCNMFRSLLALSPEDVLPAVYLCTNKIAPDHENTELNIGGSIVVAALEEACGTKKSKLNNLYNIVGDLGDVAQLCRQTQSLLAPPPVLTIEGVYSVLRKISAQTGSGSTSRKKSLIVNLMCSCRENEIKFIVRTLVRNLRIGAMMRTVLPALAQAVVMNLSHEVPENLKDHLQRLSSAVVEAYNVLPNLDLLIPTLIEKGVDFLPTTLSMIPGIPIKPMLAKISNGAPQVLKLFHGKSFSCEYKYDGQRAQIHRLVDGSVRVFSRNGDETTSKFPDLINIVVDLSAHAAHSFILDAEVVAVNRKNALKLLSFQQLSSRERGGKGSMIDTDKIKVDICIFVFDIMFANGKQLLYLPLRERRQYLKNLFGETKPGYFEWNPRMLM
ncbi:DNA ligase 6 isoform X1 [Primulina tabacum]|uniref:DNA ligase 6 isoform X1 n=1 Tax=Primulina tabacum TaxID=48773 RepID=UPI003F596BF6